MKAFILSLSVLSLILLAGDFGALKAKPPTMSLSGPERPCPSCRKA